MPFLLIFFLSIQAILRFTLWAFDPTEIPFRGLMISEGVGLFFDLVVFSYFFIAYRLYWNLLPKALYLRGVAYFAFISLILFDFIAEWIFWEEFRARFNFIAVDYLVYTHEVLHNIWESYPIVWLLSALFAISGLIFYFSFKPKKAAPVPQWKPIVLALALIIGSLYLPKNISNWSQNNYVNELSKNGIHSLFAAFWMNELAFDQFYITQYQGQTPPSLQSVLQEHNTQLIAFNESNNTNNLSHTIKNSGNEHLKNVIIVVMESMSFSFMEAGGEPNHLTPVLDKLAKESLFFSQTYATGTRTVRGLEAITLSIPPGPGSSIVKRPDNENLFSLGFLFKERGYDTRFIYGGYGYFDNMNYFFAHNGFDTVDRANFTKEEKTFANAWGLCDEDLFHKVVQEANHSYANHKPFMHVVMTTSNHRPYTFPAGRIDAPNTGGHRIPAVQYSDFSVGQLIEEAKKQPWFDNTVFVFVADHTASSAGKLAITPEKHRIPFMIYSPGFITPQEVSTITSQIDVGPTLLSLLNFSYDSQFYGWDATDNNRIKPYAFISNTQHLGYLTEKDLVILHSGKSYTLLSSNPENATQSILDAIRFYEQASDWRLLKVK